MTSINCPHCGANVTQDDALIKLWQCDYCSHSFIVEKTTSKKRINQLDPHVDQAIKTSLIQQGGAFKWQKKYYKPLGFVQFKHDEGYRTEWWVTDEKAVPFWLSEDDENFFLLQDNVQHCKDFPQWESLQPNTQLHFANQQWLVTEKRLMTYEGNQGVLCESLVFDQTRKYTYLTGKNAETLVLIFTDNQVQCRQGYWLDPFEIMECR